MLRIWGRISSINVQKVVWCCDEIGIKYERIDAGGAFGKTRTPEYLAMNPNSLVPTIDDEGFVLYESNAIVEYLDDAYAGRGQPLFPGDARERALVRRLIAEADNYFDKATDPVVDEAFAKKPEERDSARLAAALDALREETALFTRYMRGDYLAGALSAADFALYPMVGFLDRCATRLPHFEPASVLTPQLAAWKARIEALPYFDKTYPPHWKK